MSSIVISTGDRLAQARAGREAPLARGLDRLLIQAERRIERAHHLHVADRCRPAARRTRAAPCPEPWRASRREVYCGFTSRRTRGSRDAVAGPVDAAAGAAADTRPETRTRTRTDAGAGAGSGAAATPGSLRQRRRSGRRFDRAGQRIRAPRRASWRECSAARLGWRLVLRLLCDFHLRRLRDRNGDLVLAGHLGDLAAAPSSCCRRRHRRRRDPADSAR